MENEFIPYEQALELKKLGFDEPCFGRYWHEEFKLINIDKQFEKPDYVCLAPLYQQAFRWFREKHKYDITIPPSGDSNGNTIGYYYEIIFQGWDDGIESDSYDSYIEAEQACLNKLIEIVKNNK
jgi:hypothetical protein